MRWKLTRLFPTPPQRFVPKTVGAYFWESYSLGAAAWHLTLQSSGLHLFNYLMK